jgi:hypothetical protein
MSRFRYADHIEREGIGLFKRVCEMGLEGIVAKQPRAFTRRSARRGSRSMRERHKEPVAGWHTCDLACVEVEQ